jgi:SAM-dependent methyltransferase
MTTASRSIAPAPAHGTERAWSEFWADPAQSQCAAARPAIWQAVTRHWSAFARSLAPGTRVLDIGCGAGIVGRMLLDARPDLRVTGIDSATVPRSAQANLELLSDVAMESTPFPAQSFGAVVSQFAYEYGDTEATARELARVLRPGARLSLLAHHSGSAILADNGVRTHAFGAFLSQITRTAFCAGDAPAFDARMRELLVNYPDALFVALSRQLPQHLARGPGERLAVWQALEAALAPEHCVLKTLSTCRVEPAQLAEWSGPLRNICNLEPIAALSEADGTPVAWRIEGIL